LKIESLFPPEVSILIY